MRVSFSGHETFPLRSSWLKKAVDQVKLRPAIFADDDAISTFGVGKNMVRSIRHWAVLCGIIELQEASRSNFQVSELGDLLFDDNGWDPFMEDVGTAWLLHWQIVKQLEQATLWSFLFGIYRSSNFDPTTLFPEIKQWLHQQNISAPSEATLKKDFLCLGSSYAPHSTPNKIEDSLQCPLSGIGLLVREGGILYPSQKHKQALPPLVFCAILVDFWSGPCDSSQTLTIEQILRDDLSPGKALFLSETEVYDYLSSLSENPDVPFLFDDTAGIKQLVRTNDELSSSRILNLYYTSSLIENGVYV